MKTPQRRRFSSLTSRLSRVLALGAVSACMLLAPADAPACEGCKSSMSADTAAEDAGSGFAASIYFMLSMPVLLVGGLAYVGYKNVRQIENARQIEADEQALQSALSVR